MTVTISKGYDIRLSDGGSNDLQFRLLEDNGRKVWSVDELPPNPNIFTELQPGAGYSPLQDLPFIMQDWFMGAGVDRFGPDFSQPGHVLRYESGLGIDTSEPGIVKHGPLAASIGTLNAPASKFVLFLDKVWIATEDGLYDWTGSTLTLKWDASAESPAEKIRDIEVFGNKLYIATDVNDEYRQTDGSTFPPTTVTINSGLASNTTFSKFIVAVRNHPASATPSIDRFTSSLVAVMNNNQITWNSEATSGTRWISPALDVTEADNTLTNLAVLSGLLFVAAENTLYVIDDDDRVIELDTRLRLQRSTSSFKLKAESGSEVWFSSGDAETIRVVSKGLDEFDIQPEGPQFSRLERPVNFNEVVVGITEALAMDFDSVYVVKQEEGDSIVYRGRQIGRAFYTWTPLVEINNQTTVAMSVIKMTGDSAPIAYMGLFNSTVHTFVTKNWSTYAATWEMVTPFFDARLESMDKLWHTIEAFLEKDTEAKVVVSYRTDRTAAFATIGTNGELTTDGANRLLHTSAISGKTIQLKFAGSTTDSAKRVNLRSFNLTGVLRPPLKRVFAFTVVTDSKTERDALYTFRTKTDGFLTLTDRFGDKHTVFMMPGFPKEVELADEARMKPFRAYQIVAYAVDTAAV